MLLLLRMFSFKGDIRAILNAKEYTQATTTIPKNDLLGDAQITVPLSPCQWNKDSKEPGKPPPMK